MVATYTSPETYSVVDVEASFRRFRSDILMIADSTKAITREEAENYAHDAEYLAKREYLKAVDVTLVNDGVERKALRYTVNERAGDLETSRPGGVLWPRFKDAYVRVILLCTSKYTDEIRKATKPYLKVSWGLTHDDICHSGLSTISARNYVSNSYGLQRTDFG